MMHVECLRQNLQTMRASACLSNAAHRRESLKTRARCGRLTLEVVVRRDERRTNSPVCGYVPSWSSPFISDESKLLVRFDLADGETVRGSHAVLSVYRRPTTLGPQQADTREIAITCGLAALRAFCVRPSGSAQPVSRGRCQRA